MLSDHEHAQPASPDVILLEIWQPTLDGPFPFDLLKSSGTAREGPTTAAALV